MNIKLLTFSLVNVSHGKAFHCHPANGGRGTMYPAPPAWLHAIFSFNQFHRLGSFLGNVEDTLRLLLGRLVVLATELRKPVTTSALAELLLDLGVSATNFTFT